MENRKAFIYSFLGTVAGGLVLAGLLALIRYLAHVDLFSIFVFGIMPLVAIGGAVAIHLAGRDLSQWVIGVEERLDALEAARDSNGPQTKAIDRRGSSAARACTSSSACSCESSRPGR